MGKYRGVCVCVPLEGTSRLSRWSQVHGHWGPRGSRLSESIAVAIRSGWLIDFRRKIEIRLGKKNTWLKQISHKENLRASSSNFLVKSPLCYIGQLWNLRPQLVVLVKPYSESPQNMKQTYHEKIEERIWTIFGVGLAVCETNEECPHLNPIWFSLDSIETTNTQKHVHKLDQLGCPINGWLMLLLQGRGHQRGNQHCGKGEKLFDHENFFRPRFFSFQSLDQNWEMRLWSDDGSVSKDCPPNRSRDWLKMEKDW